MSETERAIRRRVEREHGDVVDAIDESARAVARSWNGDRIGDGAAVRTRLRAELDRAELLGRLATVLAESVSAAGLDLPARPVPSPPYVTVTSRGPLLRATVDPGRIAIRFDAFDVERDGRAVYRRRDGVDVSVSFLRDADP